MHYETSWKKGPTNSLVEERPATMINETEEQKHVKTEYFDQAQPDNEQAGNHGDTSGKETKPPTVKKVLKSLTSERACN